MAERLLECDQCAERATVIVLCKKPKTGKYDFLHGVRCAEHPIMTCPDCRIVGVTAVVQGG